jgi:hypothetical protein
MIVAKGYVNRNPQTVDNSGALSHFAGIAKTDDFATAGTVLR